MAPIETKIARIAVSIECPTCHAVPDEDTLAMNLRDHTDLHTPMGCTTCGKVHLRCLWMRRIMDDRALIY